MRMRINRRGNLAVSITSRIEKGYARIAETAASAALEEAARTTPQSSGDMASNWRISLDTPQPGKNANGRPYSSSGEGSMDAVGEAVMAKVPRFLVGHKFYISTFGKHKNKVKLEGGATDSYDEAYAGLVERGEIPFRNVNPSGGHILARAAIVFKNVFRAQKLLRGGK